MNASFVQVNTAYGSWLEIRLKDRKVTRPFLHGILNHSNTLQIMNPFRLENIKSNGFLPNGRILKEFNEMRYNRGVFIPDIEIMNRGKEVRWVMLVTEIVLGILKNKPTQSHKIKLSKIGF